ncbi:MAG: aspartate aminotransferase family protein [Bacteroidales bacterium]|nr:aspartate aminotransferase family protein [Bacteroidales bacterium]
MLSDKQLFLQFLGQTSPAPLMIEINSAKGVFLFGPDGKKYIDLISGVSVSNVGHNHPKVVGAIKDQVDSYTHLMVYGELVLSPQVRYASHLAEILPPALNTCYFVNSGSEAVEGALKLAKRFTGRSRIISFRNAYHGSTHGALSIQGSETYRNAFRPLLPDTYQIDFNDFESLDLIDEKTACVIVEPIQGEAGIIVPHTGFLESLRKKCSDTGTLLIFDEIQTGFGRTGYMFAADRYNVAPDIILLAKALGGGMPLGAFISSGEIMSALSSDPPLGHITTFGGHPVCCAAGDAALSVIIEENLAGSCNAKSALFRQKLKHQLITEVRGEGLMLAVQLTGHKYVEYVVANAHRYGLIMDFFLFCNSAVRLAPPLTISEEEISMACTQMLDLLDDASKNAIKA